MIADRFPRDDHQASIVSVSPFLSPLQPSHAFRLTPGHVWSTDTPSKTDISVTGAGVFAHTPPCRSHDRAGEPIDALPALRS